MRRCGSRPTGPARYHLFCDQFCGTDHAAWSATVTVMTGARLSALAGRNGARRRLVAEGQRCSSRYGCGGCHDGLSGGGGTVRAPSLNGLYRQPGAARRRQHGDRRRPLHPRLRSCIRSSRSSASYAPVMPSFTGSIGEEDLVKIIAYIKSLAPRDAGRRQRHESIRRWPRLDARDDRAISTDEKTICVLAADDRPQAHRDAVFRCPSPRSSSSAAPPRR